jgi:hypothetical protein
MMRFVIVAAFVVLVVALLWPTLSKLGFGRLPGDIVIERKRGGKFYFPFATVVLLSMLFNAIISLMYYLGPK